jgi:hypothetical protein
MNALTRLLVRTLARPRDQRGDVPGWVLVTVIEMPGPPSPRAGTVACTTTSTPGAPFTVAGRAETSWA